jgi:hypothetical protein
VQPPFSSFSSAWGFDSISPGPSALESVGGSFHFEAAFGSSPSVFLTTIDGDM